MTSRGSAGAEDGHAERLDAVVIGRVQGVGFRYFVVRTAARRGLVGWVMNTPDGSVRCVAEGPRPALEALLEDLHAGPSGAIVESVTATWSAAAGGLEGFRVRSASHPGD